MNILDKRFKYTSAAETDLKKVFARVRKELKQKQEAEAQHRIETASKVRQIKR